MHSSHNEDVQDPIDNISTLNEFQKHIEVKLDSAIFLKEDLTTGIRDLSLMFVREGLDELKKLLNNDPDDEQLITHGKLSNKINDCVYEADAVVEQAIIKFAEVEREIKLVLDAITSVKKDSDSDQLVNQLKEQYHSIVTPQITEFLTDLYSDSESVPENVKTCVESVTVLVPLYANIDTRFSELLSENEKLWSSVEDEKVELINKIHDECSSYILMGLGKAQQVPNVDVQTEKLNKTVNKIFECGIESDNIIDAANTKFYNLVEEARRDISNIAKNTHIKINDEVSDQSDDSMNEVKEIFDSTNANLKTFSKELNENLVSVPLNVRKCIEEAVNLLQQSALKIEL